jgi:hypothetical protein
MLMRPADVRCHGHAANVLHEGPSGGEPQLGIMSAKVTRTFLWTEFALIRRIN